MNVLKYIIYFITGRFTAKLAPSDPMTEAEYLAAVSAASGKTTADITAVLDAMRGVHITLGKQGRASEPIRDFFRVITSLGGTYATNDPDATLIRDNVDQNISPVPSVIEEIQDGLVVEKEGEKTQNAPEIDSIIGQPGNGAGNYGHGSLGGTLVNGKYFREGGAAGVWPTAFLVDPDGSNPIELPVVQCTPSRLALGPAPTGTTGVKRLKVVPAYEPDMFVISTQLLSPI